MKKLPLYIFLVLMFSLFTSSVFAEEKISDLNFIDSKKKDCSTDEVEPLSYMDNITKKTNGGPDWYYVRIWGVEFHKKYVHGKSFRSCIFTDGSGWYYESSKASKYDSPHSWVNISYFMGQLAWFNYWSDRLGKNNEHFPIEAGRIKKLRLIYDYNFDGNGVWNNNITLWFRKEHQARPFLEVMLKFDHTQKNRARKNIKSIKTDNLKFKAHVSSPNRIHAKVLGHDWTYISGFAQKLPSNDNNYNIDLNLKQVIDYLIQNKRISESDILPGLEITTEIWYGTGELKIKKLKYEIEKDEKIKIIKYVVTAKNKKDALFQMKSGKYSSAFEAEEDVLKRCKLFFEPYGKNMQEACYIYSIDKE